MSGVPLKALVAAWKSDWRRSRRRSCRADLMLVFCSIDMVKKPFTSAGTITAQQVRAARAWLNLSQGDLAATTLIARRAIQDFENGKREPQPRTLRDLRNALEEAGIEFLFIGEHAAGICKRDPD